MRLHILQANEVRELHELAATFFEESKMPGKLDWERFQLTWIRWISDGTGVIITVKDAERHVGLIGFTFSTHYLNGWAMANEHFWFMLPEYRKGSWAIKLLKAYVDLCKQLKVDRIGLAHLDHLQPERLKAVYKHLGWKQRETQYVMEVTYA